MWVNFKQGSLKASIRLGQRGSHVGHSICAACTNVMAIVARSINRPFDMGKNRTSELSLSTCDVMPMSNFTDFY